MHERQFEAMFSELYPVVLGYAARRTQWHVAEDVAAQVFLVAWHRLDMVPDDDEHRKAWILVVARNVLANSQRTRLRSARLDVRLRAGLAAGVPVVELDPADVVAERLVAGAAMRRLSPRDQEILQLAAWDGLDLDALATVLGCSVGAAAMRLHRARTRLERLLEIGGHTSVLRGADGHDDDDATTDGGW
ncbi:RNA polymerase sigma factor [Cellulomonas sp. P24]|uniref:RNA polymerase sigma factor n=1 Tax=Cellulomonas sp. P24 TaxID=2885206 RepID=UPI00216B56B0|nr:sigma-70 family RNA polymerase sigma factor [Cellulomonas sp. P24]MCR6492306.1 sigma-70 family RNA polymerase sigma factor [Cellulomonas sp. P24]